MFDLSLCSTVYVVVFSLTICTEHISYVPIYFFCGYGMLII